ncbi:MAG: amino acid ABC transporter permease [Candidatus Planktophila sp.]|nr:amino acid ABC transporter permease [Candidatus Planktophila sp.]MBP7902999.1 amino acid ABC transporter permease [Candidatus Planktophila sp.]
MSYTPSALQLQREEAKRRASRRSTAIALLSTLLVGAALTLIVANAQGAEAVRESFFNWYYAKKAFPRILDGILLNLRVLFIAEFFVLVFGLSIAIARTTTSPVLYPLRLIATIYTDVFRGMPLLLVLFLVGLGIPGLRLPYVPNSAVFLGTVALILTYSAYVAEVIRAGIEGVNPTQRQAARALGLSHPQTLQHVVLPQAFRNVTPPLLNDLVSLQKDSGLISVLGAVDAIRAAGIETAQSFNFTPYVVAGALFVLLTIPLTRYTDWLIRRQDRAQKAQGAF